MYFKQCGKSQVKKHWWFLCMFPNNTPEAVNRTKNLNGPLKQLLHKIRGSKNMRGRFSRIWKHIMKLNMFQERTTRWSMWIISQRIKLIFKNHFFTSIPEILSLSPKTKLKKSQTLLISIYLNVTGRILLRWVSKVGSVSNVAQARLMLSGPILPYGKHSP